MVTTIIVLSASILALALLMIYLIMRLQHEIKNVRQIVHEKDDLQELRIEEIRKSLETFQMVNDKLGEIAATHTQTSDEISKIIKETMDDVNGTVCSNAYSNIRRNI